VDGHAVKDLRKVVIDPSGWCLDIRAGAAPQPAASVSGFIVNRRGDNVVSVHLRVFSLLPAASSAASRRSRLRDLGE
jgi:hypothetical protein